MTTVATSRILKTTADFKQRLMQQEAQAVATMQQYYQHTISQYIQPKLNRLYDQILQKIQDDEDIPQSWIYERIRLENLQMLLSGQIDDFGNLALTQTRMLQHTGMQLGLQYAQQSLRDVIPTQVVGVFGVPSTKALASLVGATQSGSPLSSLFNGFGKEAADNVVKALVSGVALGNNPRVIARQVQDALGISRNRALVIARNEAIRCYRSGALETYRANDDVVGGWVWCADMSTRTCAACIAMNGTKHLLDEEFGSHVCCRCSPVPETKSWDDILGPLGIDSGGLEDTRVALRSGPDWFNEQDEETKQKILGAAKYAAYNNGDFDFSDVVAHHNDDDWGHSISVKPLKELVKK